MGRQKIRVFYHRIFDRVAPVGARIVLAIRKIYRQGHVSIDVDTAPTEKIQLGVGAPREFSVVLGRMHERLHELTEFSDHLIVDGFRLASKGRRIQWQDGKMYEIVDVFQDPKDPMLIVGTLQQR